MSGPDGADGGPAVAVDDGSGGPDGPDEAGGGGAPGAEGEPRRRRRRRRRGGESGHAGAAGPGATGAPPSGAAAAGAQAAADPPAAAAEAEGRREPHEAKGDPRGDGPRARRRRERGGRESSGGPRDGGPRDGGPRDGGPRDGGPRDGGGPPRDARDGQGDRRGGDRPHERRDGRDRRESRDPRDARDRRESRDPRDARDRRESRDPRESREPRDAREPRDTREPRPEAPRELRAYEAPAPRLEQRRSTLPPADADADADLAPEVPSEAWGTDDDGPPPAIALAADLPADAPDGDDDPLTHPALDAPAAPLGDDLVSVAGVRFVPGGRVTWFDAGEADYEAGERVLVDGERGQRLGWIAVPPQRRMARTLGGDDRRGRRVLRRANERDLRAEREGEADQARALRVAKDRAAALRLPMKVFRVEVLGQLGRGARLNVYYTSDERLDLRELIRDLGTGLGARIELRQLGVRDEAKAVGGIGSCGLTLCCTTWLPDFVPVSIKMAKDQGLVLSPTKVSGQCGRLKCCLVYEQAGYAELRKGLPKLGKRVIGARGEGRVVEVDVLRQRVRVSYGPGDTEVVPAAEVRPMFPSGTTTPPPAREGGGRGEAPGARDPSRREPPPDRDDADEADADEADADEADAAAADIAAAAAAAADEADAAAADIAAAAAAAADADADADADDSDASEIAAALAGTDVLAGRIALDAAEEESFATPSELAPDVYDPDLFADAPSPGEPDEPDEPTSLS